MEGSLSRLGSVPSLEAARWQNIWVFFIYLFHFYLAKLPWKSHKKINQWSHSKNFMKFIQKFKRATQRFSRLSPDRRPSGGVSILTRQVCQVSKAECHPQFQGRYYYSNKHLSWQTNGVCFKVKIMNVKYSGNTRASGRDLKIWIRRQPTRIRNPSFVCCFLTRPSMDVLESLQPWFTGKVNTFDLWDCFFLRSF